MSQIQKTFHMKMVKTNICESHLQNKQCVTMRLKLEIAKNYNSTDKDKKKYSTRCVPMFLFR